VLAAIDWLVAPFDHKYELPALDVSVTLLPPQNIVGPPAVIVGGSEQTMMVNEPPAMLVCVSVAEQFTVVTPMGKSDPEGGLHVIATAPSTRSLAEALYVTVAPLEEVAFVLIFAGNVRFGGVVSRTVTLNVLLLVLPEASLAVTVTTVVPSWNRLPELGEAVTTGAGSMASVAVAVKVTTAPAPDVASAVRSESVPMTGGVES